MSLSSHNWNNWLAAASLEEGTHSGHTHRRVCRPLCHLWRHCCDTVLTSDYRGAEGDRSPDNKMFRRDLFSFFSKSTDMKMWGIPLALSRGRTCCVCVSGLSLPLPHFLSCQPLQLCQGCCCCAEWHRLLIPLCSVACICQPLWMWTFWGRSNIFYHSCVE